MTYDVDLIGAITKTRSQEVRIALSDYHGSTMIDVRIFAAFGYGPELKATQKGVALRVEHLPALAAIFSSALERARDRGLIPNEGEASDG